MELTRVIHPIGQGGFYTETFSNAGGEVFNVVYDCGGFDKNGGKKMQNYLQSYLPTKIDAIFISHLHADHINGLGFLLDKYKDCKPNVILPQLSDEVILEALIYNYCFASKSVYSNVNKTIQKLKKKEYENVNVIGIKPFDNMDNISIVSIFANESTEENLELRLWNHIAIPQNTDIVSGSVFYYWKWLYIPYNSPSPHKNIDGTLTSFKNFFLQKIGLATITSDELFDIPNKYSIKQCTEIYSEYFGKGNHNSYSMTLFSGMVINDYEHAYKLKQSQKDFLRRHPMCPIKNCIGGYNPNMLYTGDFEPKDNKVDKLCEFYSKFQIDESSQISLWDTIELIQVPHHGSKDNYHADLYANPIFGFVSVGNENTYKHPDIETLSMIQSKGCCPIVVTQDKSSIKILHYNSL